MPYRRKEAGALKKINRLYAALALFALIAVFTVSLFALCSGKRVDYSESITVDAMQFGDVPTSGVTTRPRDYQNALLSNADGISGVAYGTDLYEKLQSALLACESEISLSGMQVSASELRDAMTDVINTTPALFYVNPSYQIGSYGGYIEYVKPSYKASGNALGEMKREYEALVSEISAQIRPSWSNFEKVLFVHDYLVENFEYDYSYSAYDSYSMLKNGKGVCQAYTLLCIELLGRLDIGVGAVPSTDMNHVWNCVELDGKWYHMDITWDDASAPGNYDRFDEIIYNSFLCSDSAITASGHYAWSSDLEFSSDYDGHFIRTVGRIRIAPLYDDWYMVIGGETGKISLCLADFDAGTYEEKEQIDAKWYVWGESGRYYTDCFAGLGSYHDALVISTSDTLYAYNPNKATVKLGEYSFDNGYIYGLKNKGAMLTLRIAKEPGDYAADLLYDVDLSEIKFPLEISYKNKASGEITDTYSALIGWGKEFSVKSPNVSGLIAETATVEGKMSLGGFSADVLYKAYATLKINYVFENGEEAAPSYTDEFSEVGSAYSVISPKIDSYRPSIAVVSGTMSANGITVTVVYTSTLYDLKIHYVYENGEPAAESFTANSLEFGYEYSVISPSIVGYTPNIEKVSGNISEDTEITVVYTAVKCTVKVDYLYPDGRVIETKEITVSWGENYFIESLAVKGYTADTEALSGIAESELTEYSVSYTANRYTLHIKYLYDDLTEAAPEYIASLEYGEAYSVNSPEVDSYTPSVFDVSGVMSDGDVEISVVYTLSRYTVSFWSQGELFYAIALEYGDVIPLPSETPFAPPTAEKIYTFAYWEGFSDGITVTGNMEFVAIFDEEPRKYTVIFQNYDGSVLYETLVEYGQNALYTGKTPTRPSEEGIIYTFVGFDGETENITCDSVFTAMFTDGITQYTVSFYDGLGNLIKSEKVYYGYSATPPQNVHSYSDETYEYFFESWNGKYSKVTSDTTVVAVYRKVYIEYEISFEDAKGNVIYSEKLHYGDTVNQPILPTKESNERYDYIFEKWSPDFSETVKGSARYIPVFTAVYKYDYSAEEFISAVESIENCKSLSERFAALSTALKMRNSVYLGDDGVSDAIALLEAEIRIYNEEIARINSHFEKASKETSSYLSERVSVIKTVSLALGNIKKRRDGEDYDEK